MEVDLSFKGGLRGEVGAGVICEFVSTKKRKRFSVRKSQSKAEY